MRLWVDTDVGTDPDDAVALLVAAAHPEVVLGGVSTVGSDAARRAEVARELVDVPVVAGGDVHALREGLDTARPDALLAIGPLTNVASLLEVGGLPPRLALMGGVLRPVRHRGAVRAVEHNLGTDPAAAATVLARCPGARVVPLDVTVALRLTAGEQEVLVGAAPVLAPAVDAWTSAQRGAGVPADEAQLCLHDPLALLALAGEPVVTVEPRRLAVLPDGRLVERPDAPEHALVVGVDRDAALGRILDLLAR
ncbi:MAG: nucleoside hydrolase [Acidimicrobiia bacterium]|nr:nucleoside hydrolase [Acidimicrobiia bacterium]